VKARRGLLAGADVAVRPTFVVRLEGAPAEVKTALRSALLEVPIATDEELGRIDIVEDDRPADAVVFVADAEPNDASRSALDELARAGGPFFVAVRGADVVSVADDDEQGLRAPWGALVDPVRVHVIAVPVGSQPRGVDALRAALLDAAIAGAHLPVERVRRAKRPLAIAIISGAAVVSAGEGFLPGAAALVIATQASAISSLLFLYTGRWLGRTQALAILPAFAAEAAGGSVFLLVKSFFPPTGVADVLAAAVAGTMTLTVLGTIAFALDQGYSLDEKDKLKSTFRKLRARSRAERKAIAENRKRWGERAYWAELAERIIFPSR
jgi:hypothetical protein